MHTHRSPAFVLAAFGFLTFFCGRPLASSSLSEEDWYAVRIAGQRAGYLHQKTERVERDGVRIFKTRAESLLAVRRLGASLELRTNSIYLETENGDLLEVVSELKFSAVPMKSEARVEDGQVILKSFLGGSSTAQERRIPFTGRLLGPEGIRRAAESGLNKPGDTVVVQSFLPELSKPVTVTQVLESIEPLPESRPPQEALRVTETNSAAPQKRTAWLDRRGRTLYSTDASPFGELTARLTSREEAVSPSSTADVALLRFEETLARSNVRLPQARAIDSVRLRLERRDPGLGTGWAGFDGPGQHILEKTDQHVVLLVERPSPPAGRSTAAGTSPEAAGEFLQANSYLDTHDERLRLAVSEALAGMTAEEKADTLRRALHLENWVSGHMKFDAGLAFAPSSEVVRHAKGTCAEYAVLLAAMLRTDGIPSRLLIGYVYLNGVWGGHAWVEALIDGEWMSFDAAVNGPGPADAARFALARSSLNEGLGDLLAGGQALLGNLKVTVQEYSLHGKSVPVDPRAPLYLVLGDVYINAALGIRLRKPDGFVFEDLERTWPEDTLLAMKGPRGEVIRVHQDAWRPGPHPEESAYLRLEEMVPGGTRSRLNVSGRSWPLVTAKDGDDAADAATAVLNGVDVWLFRSKGTSAVRRLKDVLETFSAGALLAPPL